MSFVVTQFKIGWLIYTGRFYVYMIPITYVYKVHCMLFLSLTLHGA